MPEHDVFSLNFVFAIVVMVAVVVMIVIAYVMQSLSYSRRLRQAQQFSAAVVEFTPALMIIVFDGQNRVVAYNKSSESFTGYAAAEILGKKAPDLTFLPAILRESENADSNAPDFVRVTAALTLKDGNERVIEWQIRDFMDQNGKTELKIASGLDITELKVAEEKLRALTANLSAAEDRERKRIAEDLHDRIGEILIVSNRKIADLKAKLASPESNSALDDLSQTIQAFLKATRSLIFELIPPVLYDIGLEAAIESLASHFKKQHKIAVTVENDHEEKPVTQDVAMFLYKTVRELLLNAVRHAGATSVRIDLRRVDGRYRIVVADDGAGFKAKKPAVNEKNGGGFGLFNIKNQAEYYKGGLEIDAAPGKGSRLTIWIPLHEKPENEAYEN